jgi:hypothetical protein
MTYTGNMITVRTYSVCHNHENRQREEGMCEIMDKSRNQKVTLFGCINLGSKLNSNKTRSWLHTSKCTWLRSHQKRMTPMNRHWWEQSQQIELLQFHISQDKDLTLCDKYYLLLPATISLHVWAVGWVGYFDIIHKPTGCDKYLSDKIRA